MYPGPCQEGEQGVAGALQRLQCSAGSGGTWEDSQGSQCFAEPCAQMCRSILQRPWSHPSQDSPAAQLMLPLPSSPAEGGSPSTELGLSTLQLARALRVTQVACSERSEQPERACSWWRQQQGSPAQALALRPQGAGPAPRQRRCGTAEPGAVGARSHAAFRCGDAAAGTVRARAVDVLCSEEESGVAWECQQCWMSARACEQLAKG